MNRFKLGLLSAAMVAAMAGPCNALALDTVGASMPCSDQSGSLAVNTDTATVGSLALATQGMLDSPSGLSCNLTQTSVSTANGPQNFAVGGGQFLDSCGIGEPFPVNFSFSAHSDVSGGNVQGTVNLTFPADQSCFPQSHETGAVLCLTVVGNNANFSGAITHSSGAFVNNQYFEAHATDNGDPQNGHPVDTVSIFGQLTFTGCGFNVPGQFPVSSGNIVVHQAS